MTKNGLLYESDVISLLTFVLIALGKNKIQLYEWLQYKACEWNQQQI